MSEQKKNILFKEKDHTGYITFNRPEKNNAFTAEMLVELLQILEQIEKKKNLRAIILNANGDNFSAGADLTWMRKMADYSLQENEKDAATLANVLEKLNELKKPTIALLKGRVMGGGIGIAASCDIVIATNNTQFCFSEVRLGLVPATIAPYVIAKIGISAARRYFLTAELFDTTAALQMGLIHQVVAENKLNETGNEFSDLITENSPEALATAKELIQMVIDTDPDLKTQTVELLAEIRCSEEAQEGMRAFLEKRPPNWIKI